MTANENLANALRRIKEERRKSISEMSEELGIAQSTLEIYLNSMGNPRMDTLELMSERLQVPITQLVSAPLQGLEQAETIARAAVCLASLPADRQEQCIQLMREIAALFAGTENA